MGDQERLREDRMSKLKDAQIRNLRQRLDKALAEAKRQKDRADDLELNLDLAEEELRLLLYKQPQMIRLNYGVMH